MQLAAGFGGRLGQVARTGRSLVQGSGGSSAAGRDPAPYSSQLLRMRAPSPRVGPHNPGARCSHRQVASPSMVDSSRQLAPTCDHTRCDNWNKRMEKARRLDCGLLVILGPRNGPLTNHHFARSQPGTPQELRKSLACSLRTIIHCPYYFLHQ